MLGFSLGVKWNPLTFVELSGVLSSKALCGRCCMLRCTTTSVFKASKLDGLNCQCRGTLYYLLKYQALLLTCSKYAATAFLTH